MTENNEPLLGFRGVKGSRLDSLHLRWAATKRSLQAPTPRNLLIMSLLVGVVAGLISLLYSYSLTQLLKVVWVIIPHKLVLPGLVLAEEKLGWPAPEHTAGWFILLVAVVFGGAAGLAHKVLGYPGDVPNTLECVHKKGYIPITQAPSMFICSTFSIVSGASVGPEAPVLAVCAAGISWISRMVFQQRGRMLRSCTLMGMAAGLTSLFGVTLGGAIFAFEVLHSNGVQYFEALPYGVFASILCLTIHRGMWNLEPFGAIWEFEEGLKTVDSRHILIGLVLGGIGLLITYVFHFMMWGCRVVWDKLGLVDTKRPILAGAFGGLVIGIIGVFLPATMFWSEFELKSIADTDVPLAHVWPKEGFWGFTVFKKDKYTAAFWALLGFTKLFTICASVVSGLRGGFIFPLMFAGACIGNALAAIPHIPWWSNEISAALPALALAGAVTTGITKSPFSCALILATLAGIPEVTAPTLAASMVTFFGTLDKPFFKTQQDREDIQFLDSEQDDIDSFAASDEGCQRAFLECSVSNTESTECNENEDSKVDEDSDKQKLAGMV